MFPSAKGSTMVLSAYFVHKETSIYYSVYYCALECMQTWQEGGEGSEGAGEGARTGVCARVCVCAACPRCSHGTHGLRRTVPFSMLASSTKFYS